MATHVSHENEKRSCCSPTSSFSRVFKKQQTRMVDSTITDVLSKNLNQLSVEEREHILEDIHGVADTIEETPDFLAKKLEKLDELIGKVKGKHAYNLAMGNDTQYVKSKAFRLMFLRSEEFNVEKTARKIVTHFEEKLKLFGEDKLVKDITYDDLSIDDQASLCTGSHQYLGVKDQKRRSVAFVFPGLMHATTWESFSRARWYQVMLAVSDESSQRDGIVFVILGNYQKKNFVNSMKAQRIVNTALPLRPVCVHLCIINQTIPLSTRSMFHILETKFQLRFRIHLEETTISLLYSLQSFGINPGAVPLGHDGQPKKRLFLERLEKTTILERRKEESIKTTEKVRSSVPQASTNNIVPTKYDVLLGQRKGLNHPGNVALNNMIDMEIQSRGHSESNFHKTCNVLAAVQRVYDNGGRFLKYDIKADIWSVVDDQAARATVSIRFRNRRKKLEGSIRTMPAPASKKTLTASLDIRTMPIPLKSYNQQYQHGRQSQLPRCQQTQYRLEILKQSQLQLLNNNSNI